MKSHLLKHKKRLISAVLSGSMLLSAGASALAFDDEAIFSSIFSNALLNTQDLSESGYALKRLGLIAGDENGDLMLDKIGTRQEALTLFLALLGEQDNASAVPYSYTFRDIDDWFSNFAGYGVYRGYTAGYSEMQFGSWDAITPEQYMTFVLHALNYNEEDFVWTASLDKAVEIGLCTQLQADGWKNSTFRRQEIMEISYLALSTKLKNSNCTLTDKLIADGEITEEEAQAENLTFGETYVDFAESDNRSTINYDTMPTGTYELHNVGAGQIMTTYPVGKQSDVCLANDVNAVTQQFNIISNSDGSFRIVSASNTSLAVDVHPTDGADAILWTVNGTDCQNYVAVAVSQGIYSIRLAANPDMALTAVDGDVRLCQYNGSTCQQWKLSDNSENTTAASTKLQSIMKIYPSGKNLGSGYSFAGAVQCMGFGREVFYRMYGVTAKWNYDGSPKTASDAKLYTITAKSASYSASSMKALISKAKPGDILQMNGPKMHTMVFVSSDSNGFTVYDANWTASNQVSVRYVKYGAWAGRNSAGISVLHATNYPTT